MFFKNIAEWENKKLRTFWIIISLLQLICSLIAPIVVVAINYDLFKKGSTYKLTAVGWIVVICVLIVGLKYLRKLIARLPEDKFSQQRMKYGLEFIIALIPYIIMIVALGLLKSSFDKAWNTLLICTMFFVASEIIECLFLKFIDREKALRQEAIHLTEVEKRK